MIVNKVFECLSAESHIENKIMWGRRKRRALCWGQESETHELFPLIQGWRETSLLYPTSSKGNVRENKNIATSQHPGTNPVQAKLKMKIV